MNNQPEFVLGLMPPEMGPPLPKAWGIYWPWYKPKEVPKEERPPVIAYPPVAYPPVAAPVVAYPPAPPPAAPPVIVYPPRPEPEVPVPEVTYVCPVCGAQFSDLSDWYAHMEKVHPAAPPEAPMEIFSCPICGAQFSTFEELQAHMAEAHPPEFSITTLSYPPGGGTITTDKPTYQLGEQVRLTARPSPGYEFSHWEGIPGMPTNLTYRFPIDRDMIITGVFKLLERLPPEAPMPPKVPVAPPVVPEVPTVPPVVPPPPEVPPVGYTLSIHVRPMAAGRVIKEPDKLTYTYGEIVKLTASPVPQPFVAPKYKFSHWEVNGEFLDYINPINYMVTKDYTVTARFREV